MALSIQVVVDVTGESQGAPGVARSFSYVKLQTAPTVTLSLESVVGVNSYNWEFVSIPVGSSAALSSSSVAEPTFAPDVPGTYLVQCTVNDGEAWDVNAVAFRTKNRDLRKPAAGETVAFDQSTGWFEANDELFEEFDKIAAAHVTDVIGAINEDLLTTASEVVIGGMTFDGSAVPGFFGVKFRFIGEVTDPDASPAAVGSVRLYDMGPAAGPPTSPSLRATASLDASTDEGDFMKVDTALSVVSSFTGTNNGEILDSDRLYQVRAYLTANAGGEELKIAKASIIVEES